MSTAEPRAGSPHRHLAIVSQWFPPEQAPIGQMLTELADALAEQGWRVTVVTGFPNHPSGVVFGGYQKGWHFEEVAGRVRVLRSWLYTSPNRTFWRRVLTAVTFSLSSAWALLREKNLDAIFAVSQPLSVGVLLAGVARLKNARLILNVQDLHPDVPISVGLVKNPVLIAVLRYLERFGYRHADGLAVICEGFANHVGARGAREGAVCVIPNWIDTDFIQPGPRINGFRQELGFGEEAFVVLYAGTIGYVSGAGVLIEAARLLSDVPTVKILFVGEGPLVAELKGRANDLGLTNVVFRPFQDRSRLNEVQACADLAVVSLAPGKGKFSVPSKVLGYMAAARPVVASVDSDSETGRFIQAAECGVVVGAGDSDLLAETIRALSEDKVRATGLGGAGRHYVVAHHAKDVITQRYHRFLSDRVTG